METLSIVMSKNYSILSKFDAEDAAAPLLYTDKVSRHVHMLNAEQAHARLLGCGCCVAGACWAAELWVLCSRRRLGCRAVGAV